MEGERCPSHHRFSGEQCTREKGHDGVCSGRAQRGATTITRAEWWSKNGEYKSHHQYVTIYLSNNQPERKR